MRGATLAWLGIATAVSGCGTRSAGMHGSYLFVSGSTAAVWQFVRKEAGCRPDLAITRPRREAGTQSQVVVTVPASYGDAALAQLSREAAAERLRYRFRAAG